MHGYVSVALNFSPGREVKFVGLSGRYGPMIEHAAAKYVWVTLENFFEVVLSLVSSIHSHGNHKSISKSPEYTKLFTVGAKHRHFNVSPFLGQY